MAQGRVRLRLIEPLPRHELPEHDRRGVDVRLAIDLLPRELLGRHVRELAGDAPFVGGLDPADDVGDAEVEHPRDTVGADQDVLRRNVAMNDGEWLTARVLALVRRVEPVERARHHRRDDLRRDARAERRVAADELRERFALHVVHDDEELALHRHDVERLHDVGVPKARREARFVEEHRDELGVLRELRVEALDRNRAPEADLAHETTVVNRCHAAGGNLSVHGVAAHDSKRR
jgi:hypothetical protein